MTQYEKQLEYQDHLRTLGKLRTRATERALTPGLHLRYERYQRIQPEYEKHAPRNADSGVPDAVAYLAARRSFRERLRSRLQGIRRVSAPIEDKRVYTPPHGDPLRGL